MCVFPAAAVQMNFKCSSAGSSLSVSGLHHNHVGEDCGI